MSSSNITGGFFASRSNKTIIGNNDDDNDGVVGSGSGPRARPAPKMVAGRLSPSIFVSGNASRRHNMRDPVSGRKVQAQRSSRSARAARGQARDKAAIRAGGGRENQTRLLGEIIRKKLMRRDAKEQTIMSMSSTSLATMSPTQISALSSGAGQLSSAATAHAAKLGLLKAGAAASMPAGMAAAGALMPGLGLIVGATVAAGIRTKVQSNQKSSLDIRAKTLDQAIDKAVDQLVKKDPSKRRAIMYDPVMRAKMSKELLIKYCKDGQAVEALARKNDVQHVAKNSSQR